jgi:hypothetical protein
VAGHAHVGQHGYEYLYARLSLFWQSSGIICQHPDPKGTIAVCRTRYTREQPTANQEHDESEAAQPLAPMQTPPTGVSHSTVQRDHSHPGLLYRVETLKLHHSSAHGHTTLQSDQRPENTPSPDEPIGLIQHLWRNRQPKRFGNLEIDHELDVCIHLHGKFCWVCPIENFVH